MPTARWPGAPGWPPRRAPPRPDACCRATTTAWTPHDVQALRDAGHDDTEIFAITLFVALRIAFSTVNDALGARPDPQLAAGAPEEVRTAVSFGRPVSDG